MATRAWPGASQTNGTCIGQYRPRPIAGRCWLGRLNRYVSQIKQDIDRDIKLEELRKMQQDMKDTAQRYEIMAHDTARQVEETVAEETGQISKVMQAMSATDGGLTMNEWDKAKAEEAAKVALPEEPAALDEPLRRDSHVPHHESL